jgi:broad specificity phosphatase PhoE
MELDDLRELNVGELDGRSDPRAWDTYTRVLAAWRAGETRATFPQPHPLVRLLSWPGPTPG